MRSIFGANSKGSEALLQELAEARSKAFEDKKEYQERIATTQGRFEEQKKWFARKSDRIQSNYMALVAAFDADDSAEANKVVFSMGDLAPFVLNMKVIDENGHETTFLNWAETAFSDSSGNVLMKREMEKLMVQDILPIFEEINVELDLKEPTYAEIEKTTFGGITGKYADTIQDAINETRTDADYDRRRYSSELSDIQAQQQSFKDESLSELSEQMKSVAVLLRFSQALDGTSDDLYEVLSGNLDYLYKENGFEQTLSWVLYDQKGAEKMLAKSKYPIGDERHPLQALLETMPNEMKKAALLMQLSEIAPYPKMKKELEEAALGKAGGYLRVNENTLFMTEKMGFIEYADGNLKTACSGRKLEAPIEKGMGAATIDFLDTQDGFAKTSAQEVSNPATITRMYLGSEDGEGKVTLHTDYFGRGWKETMSRERAAAIIEKASEDERFVQLDDKTLIDKTLVDHAWLSGENGSYEIGYVMNAETHKISLQDEARAHEILAAFAEDETAVYMGDNEVVKMSSVGHMWAADSDSESDRGLYFAIKGKTYVCEMGFDEAKEYIKAPFGKKYGQIKVSATESINPENISLIYQDSDNSKLVYVIDGKEYASEALSGSKSGAIIDFIEENYPESFFRHQRMGLLNIDKTGRVHYDESDSKLKYMMNDSSWQSSMASKNLSRLKKFMDTKDNFISAGDNTYIDFDRVGAIYYNKDNGHLEFVIDGIRDEQYGAHIGEVRALDYIDGLEKKGREIAMAKFEESYDGVELEDYKLPEEPKKSAKTPAKEIGEHVPKTAAAVFNSMLPEVTEYDKSAKSETASAPEQDNAPDTEAPAAEDKGEDKGPAKDPANDLGQAPEVTPEEAPKSEPESKPEDDAKPAVRPGGLDGLNI